MDKRKFLYYNLYNIDLNKRILIYNYINENEIQHSENSNGLLLNLSQLDSKHVDFLYDLYNLENHVHENVFPNMASQTKKVNKPVPDSNIYKDYPLKPLEKLILSYSY
jgi:hypothetical protein|tara:strand:+ start:2337 stop:2660 length:324 start_codon:yes stop_codon:yes gene_type:complete